MPQALKKQSNKQSNFSNLVKSSAANLEGRKLLQADVDSLLGITTNVTTILKDEMHINSIFDLATSQVFNSALNLIDPQGTIAKEYSKHGFVPADAISGDPTDPDSTVDLGGQGLEQLNFRTPTTADNIKQALNIETIRDLALWTPFQTARGILNGTFGGDDSDLADYTPPDPEMPQDLVPKNGNLPTERAYYKSLYLIDTDLTDNHLQNVGATSSPESEDKPEGEDDATQPMMLDISRNKGQLDIGQLSLFAGGFTKPAVGVMMTSEQSWYSEGVTLGRLLHSLALAPGESTRIAVIDWTRRTQGKRQEEVAQKEDSSADTGMEQALQEVTDAVAKETQEGSSTAESSSDSSQSGGSDGLSLGFIHFGGSSSSSHNRSLATNVSRSSGSRNLSSRMNRDIHGSTHQSASAARSRRTAVIQETSEGEGENLTTRVVTNYNHMHALSVQYYEVVQDYRVVTKATQYDRVAFIPFKLFDFKDYRIIEKYRQVLEQAALTEKVKELLPTISKENWREGNLITLVDWNGNECYTIPFSNPQLWKIDFDLNSASSSYFFTYARIKSNGTKFGGDTNSRQGSLQTSGISTDKIEFIEPYINCRGSSVDFPVKLTYHFRNKEGQNGHYAHTVMTHYRGNNSPGRSFVQAIKFKVTQAKVESLKHFNENALYYSQAIWASLDETEWMKALSGFTYRGESIGANLDPMPLSIMGNYVAFPWHFTDETRKLDWLLEYKLLRKDFRLWMKKKGYKKVTAAAKEAYLDEHVEIQGDEGRKETNIPMPTAGVFAEAVLGRFNSAEKLDMTRFWNWKDSPIPIVPTEINPLKAGGRGAAELLKNLKAQGLDPQAIHLHTEAPAPNAAAMGDGTTAASMKSLLAANIFRDMSNAVGTASLAQQGLTSAQAGATEAGKQATESMKITAEQATQNLKMLADVAQSLIGGGGSSGSQNISNAGATLNAAEKIDETTEGSGEGEGGSDGESEANGGSNKEDVLNRIIGHWKSTTSKGKTPTESEQPESEAKERWKNAAAKAKAQPEEKPESEGE